MKCPQCGQWNKASLPRCFKCGAPLDADDVYNVLDPETLEWKQALRDDPSQKRFIQVDEDGDQHIKADERETLADEMARLKTRKQRGEIFQRQLREEGAKHGFAPSSLTVRTHTTRETFFTMKDDPSQTLGRTGVKAAYDEPVDDASALGDAPVGNVPATGQSQSSAPEHQVYDGFNDSRSYQPLWEQQQAAYTPTHYTRPQDTAFHHKSVRRMGFRRFLRVAIILVLVCLVGMAGIVAYRYVKQQQEALSLANQPTIVASMLDDMAAHTILIPGNEGDQIYIRELYSTYIVSGGVATVQVADHIWYDNYADYLQETMEVTLTPMLKNSSGQQTPLTPITYEITIPLSPIELVSPDIHRVEVSTAMYTIQLRVSENSTVSINGEDLTDMVKSNNGEVTYNATIQPIGDNLFTIKVRSQYCRENTEQIIIYRARQDIPLDLASDTYTTSSVATMKVSATTLPGAIVNVLSPYTDLDITNIDSTGTFTFNAVFDKIGTNTITITADYPGKEQSVINYNVYYVPPADTYTTKAWPMDSANYADLLSNNSMRVAKTQIYVCVGTIEYIVSDKPQLAVMNCGESGKSMTVLLENNSKTTWVVGQHYSVYADAYGMYDEMPWLVVRYTYY